MFISTDSFDAIATQSCQSSSGPLKVKITYGHPETSERKAMVNVHVMSAGVIRIQWGIPV